jgi:predicted HD phosphohydrolase
MVQERINLPTAREQSWHQLQQEPDRHGRELYGVRPHHHVGRRHLPAPRLNDFHNEDQEARQRGQELSHRIIYKNWGPKYVSNPEKRMAFRWKLFMDDYVPDWEKRIDWEKQ